ncbi:MAG: response regulator transcription factor [Chloroflexota bacterium]|nr:response regulator transcription factor [Chloroflexota bacterium]
MNDEPMNDNDEPIRVLLADDHPPVRAGVRGALEKAADVAVVGEAGDGEEALRLIEELRADVALLDCRLPGLEGAQVAEAIRARGLPTRVLALSAFADDEYIHGMLQAGAAGYLLKEEALETVVEAVRAVAGGEEWYSQQVMDKVAAWTRGETVAPPGVAGLTGREVEVLRLLARGWDNARIAEKLCISEGTVKNHVTSIYAKLGMRSRAEAVAWAWQHGVMGGR